MVHNVKHEVKAGKLIITCDIGTAACEIAKGSSSGKTRLVAKTGTAVEIPGPNGWKLTFALNVMGKPPVG